MTDLSELNQRIRSRRRELDSLSGESRSITNRLEELREEVSTLSSDIVVHERVTTLLNSIGEEKQLAAQEAIEQLVTRGLQTIFDESLSFHIIQDVKARRAEVSFIVRSTRANGEVVDTDVMEARGGGLAATVGFLLRLVVMLLRTSTTEDNVLILDETFSMVSAEYLPAVGEFLRKIVDKTGVQILLVTHQTEFLDYADNVYRLHADENGNTLVTEK